MTAKAVIRAAREDEHALLTDLALRSKAHWGYSEQFMADCADELTISEEDIREHPFFVVEKRGDVIGFCGLQMLNGARGELTGSVAMYTAPNIRPPESSMKSGVG